MKKATTRRGETRRLCVEVALLCSSLSVASCCPELAPKASADPLRYPTGLRDGQEAGIQWIRTSSGCATDSTVANGGSLSILLTGSDPTAGGISCEFSGTLQLPENVYLRSMTAQVRGLASVGKGEALVGRISTHADCRDQVTLVEVEEAYAWRQPDAPGASPDEATIHDVALDGTATMTTAGDSMCDGRSHEIKVVTTVSVAGKSATASSAALDSVDLRADVAACSGPRFESMCEWARIAYQSVARTDDVDPPTPAVADALAAVVGPDAAAPIDPSCTDDVPVVRAAAQGRLRSRRDALAPLLQQRCAEPLPDSRDLGSGARQRQCRARHALEFLGESTANCGCKP